LVLPRSRLKLHRIETMLGHVAQGHHAGFFKEPVGQRRLPVVDVGDDAEVSDILLVEFGHTSSRRRNFSLLLPNNTLKRVKNQPQPCFSRLNMLSPKLTGNVTVIVRRLYIDRLSYRRRKKKEENEQSEQEGNKMKFTVKLRDANSVKDFVKITSQYSEDLSLVHGRYVVDAKSILGIFSMDLTRPMELVSEGANDNLKEDLKAYVI
jgi:hypothetical protein